VERRKVPTEMVSAERYGTEAIGPAIGALRAREPGLLEVRGEETDATLVGVAQDGTFRELVYRVGAGWRRPQRDRPPALVRRSVGLGWLDAFGPVAHYLHIGGSALRVSCR